MLLGGGTCYASTRLLHFLVPVDEKMLGDDPNILWHVL